MKVLHRSTGGHASVFPQCQDLLNKNFRRFRGFDDCYLSEKSTYFSTVAKGKKSRIFISVLITDINTHITL